MCVVAGRLDGQRKMACIAVIDKEHVPQHISSNETVDALFFESGRKHGDVSDMYFVLLDNRGLYRIRVRTGHKQR